MKHSSEETLWPAPHFDPGEEPHFLFIITPPFSGSTALAKILNTSHRTVLLENRGEGQWLVPGLCQEDRWNPDKQVDYASVRAVWMSRFQMLKQFTPGADVVVEKSPPNMVRIEQLANIFPNHSFIANNRNPYASCSSRLYRNFKGAQLDPAQRLVVLERLLADWLTRSAVIQALVVRRGIPLLTYEEFCQHPPRLLDILRLPVGVTDTINPAACVQVKDYQPQPIINQNERQMARLTDAETAHMAQQLAPHQRLLAFFGYQMSA